MIQIAVLFLEQWYLPKLEISVAISLLPNWFFLTLLDNFMYVKVQMVKIDSFLTAYDLMVPVM